MELCKCCRKVHKNIPLQSAWEAMLDGWPPDDAFDEIGKSSLTWFDEMSESVNTANKTDADFSTLSAQDASADFWSPCPRGGRVFVTSDLASPAMDQPGLVDVQFPPLDSPGLLLHSSQSVARSRTSLEHLAANQMDVTWTSAMATPAMCGHDASILDNSDWKESPTPLNQTVQSPGVATTEAVKRKVLQRKLFSPGQLLSRDDSLSQALEAEDLGDGDVTIREADEEDDLSCVIAEGCLDFFRDKSLTMSANNTSLEQPEVKKTERSHGNVGYGFDKAGMEVSRGANGHSLDSAKCRRSRNDVTRGDEELKCSSEFVPQPGHSQKQKHPSVGVLEYTGTHDGLPEIGHHDGDTQRMPTAFLKSNVGQNAGDGSSREEKPGHACGSQDLKVTARRDHIANVLNALFSSSESSQEEDVQLEAQIDINRVAGMTFNQDEKFTPSAKVGGDESADKVRELDKISANATPGVEFKSAMDDVSSTAPVLVFKDVSHDFDSEVEGVVEDEALGDAECLAAVMVDADNGHAGLGPSDIVSEFADEGKVVQVNGKIVESIMKDKEVLDNDFSPLAAVMAATCEVEFINVGANATILPVDSELDHVVSSPALAHPSFPGSSASLPAKSSKSRLPSILKAHNNSKSSCGKKVRFSPQVLDSNENIRALDAENKTSQFSKEKEIGIASVSDKGALVHNTFACGNSSKIDVRSSYLVPSSSYDGYSYKGEDGQDELLSSQVEDYSFSDMSCENIAYSDASMHPAPNSEQPDDSTCESMSAQSKNRTHCKLSHQNGNDSAEADQEDSIYSSDCEDASFTFKKSSPVFSSPTLLSSQVEEQRGLPVQRAALKEVKGNVFGIDNEADDDDDEHIYLAAMIVEGSGANKTASIKSVEHGEKGAFQKTDETDADSDLEMMEAFTDEMSGTNFGIKETGLRIVKVEQQQDSIINSERLEKPSAQSKNIDERVSTNVALTNVSKSRNSSSFAPEATSPEKSVLSDVLHEFPSDAVGVSLSVINSCLSNSIGAKDSITVLKGMNKDTTSRPPGEFYHLTKKNLLPSKPRKFLYPAKGRISKASVKAEGNNAITAEKFESSVKVFSSHDSKNSTQIDATKEERPNINVNSASSVVSNITANSADASWEAKPCEHETTEAKMCGPKTKASQPFDGNTEPQFWIESELESADAQNLCHSAGGRVLNAGNEESFHDEGTTSERRAEPLFNCIRVGMDGSRDVGPPLGAVSSASEKKHFGFSKFSDLFPEKGVEDEVMSCVDPDRKCIEVGDESEAQVCPDVKEEARENDSVPVSSRSPTSEQGDVSQRDLPVSGSAKENETFDRDLENLPSQIWELTEFSQMLPAGPDSEANVGEGNGDDDFTTKRSSLPTVLKSDAKEVFRDEFAPLKPQESTGGASCDAVCDLSSSSMLQTSETVIEESRSISDNVEINFEEDLESILAKAKSTLSKRQEGFKVPFKKQADSTSRFTKKTKLSMKSVSKLKTFDIATFKGLRGGQASKSCGFGNRFEMKNADKEKMDFGDKERVSDLKSLESRQGSRKQPCPELSRSSKDNFEGFSTASGKMIAVSEKAKEKANDLMKSVDINDDDDDATSVNCQDGKMSNITGSGTEGWEIRMNARNKTENKGSDSSPMNNFETFICDFSSAGGKNIALSLKSRERAVQMWHGTGEEKGFVGTDLTNRETFTPGHTRNVMKGEALVSISGNSVMSPGSGCSKDVEKRWEQSCKSHPGFRPFKPPKLLGKNCSLKRCNEDQACCPKDAKCAKKSDSESNSKRDENQEYFQRIVGNSGTASDDAHSKHFLNGQKDEDASPKNEAGMNDGPSGIHHSTVQAEAVKQNEIIADSEGLKDGKTGQNISETFNKCLDVQELSSNLEAKVNTLRHAQTKTHSDGNYCKKNITTAIHNSSKFPGFSTASGSKVKISEDALKHPKGIFDENDTDEITLNTAPGVANLPGKSVVVDSPVKTSENDLKPEQDFDEVNTVTRDVANDTDVGRNSSRRSIVLDRVSSNNVSKSSPNNASKAPRFDDRSGSGDTNSVRCTAGFPGFCTASGSKVNVSGNALMHVKDVFDEGCTSHDDNVPGITENVNDLRELSSALRSDVKPSEKSSKISLDEGAHTRDKMSTAQCAVNFPGFSTVLGSKVGISVNALKNAKTFFNNDDSTMKDVTERAHCHSRAAQVGMRDKSSPCSKTLAFQDTGTTSINGVHKDSSAQGSVTFPGFSTASGSKVDISDKAMKHAKTFFDEDPSESDASNSHNNTPCNANTTAQGTNTKDVQKKSFANRNVTFPGFSTALGCKVDISDDAMKHAKTFFDEDPSGPGTSNSHNNNTPCNASTTAQGTNTRDVQKKSFANRNVTFPGFSTALGSKVDISDDAMKHAKTFFNEDPSESDASNSHNNNTPCNASTTAQGTNTRDVQKKSFANRNVTFPGFSTALGCKVDISDDAMKHAKTFFDEDPSGPGTSNSHNNNTPCNASTTAQDTNTRDVQKKSFANRNVTFPGFSTALGSKVDISDDAMKHAKTFFDEDPSGPGTSNSHNNNTPCNASTTESSTLPKSRAQVPAHALQRAKNTSGDHGRTSRNTNFESNTTTHAFSTASGSKVNVSKDSLSRAKSLFGEDSYCVNTSTANENSADVSRLSVTLELKSPASETSESVIRNVNEVVTRSKCQKDIGEHRAVLNSSEDIPDSLNLKMGSKQDVSSMRETETGNVRVGANIARTASDFPAFSTASGSSVLVSDKSLKYAKSFFNENADEKIEDFYDHTGNTNTIQGRSSKSVDGPDGYPGCSQLDASADWSNLEGCKRTATGASLQDVPVGTEIALPVAIESNNTDREEPKNFRKRIRVPLRSSCEEHLTDRRWSVGSGRKLLALQTTVPSGKSKTAELLDQAPHLLQSRKSVSGLSCSIVGDAKRSSVHEKGNRGKKPPCTFVPPASTLPKSDECPTRREHKKLQKGTETEPLSVERNPATKLKRSCAGTETESVPERPLLVAPRAAKQNSQKRQGRELEEDRDNLSEAFPQNPVSSKMDASNSATSWKATTVDGHGLGDAPEALRHQSKVFEKNSADESTKSSDGTRGVQTDPAGVPVAATSVRDQLVSLNSSCGESDLNNEEENQFLCENVTDLGNGRKPEDSQVVLTTSGLPCLGSGGPGTAVDLKLEEDRMRQEKIIRGKKRRRVTPLAGRWWNDKVAHGRRPKLQDVVGDIEHLAKNELIQHGVSESTLSVNSRSAGEMRFDLRRFFPSLTGSVLLGDGALLVPDRHGFAGAEEFYSAFLTLDGVDPGLVDRDWLRNHYRWIVWKLATYEVCYPAAFANRCLTPDVTMLQLKYRYDREIDRCQRSAIRKIVEKDDTPCKRMVLCVADIRSSGNQVSVVELTDGWYSIAARLDPPLQDLAARKRLVIGQKLVMSGVELNGIQDGCSPLEIPESAHLDLHFNATRPARADCKLGFCPLPLALCVPLASLHPEGGTVGCVDVVVTRIYPLLYMEKCADKGCIFRTAEEEDTAQRKDEELRQNQMEKMCAAIQQEMDAQNDRESKQSRRGRRRRKWSRRQVEQLSAESELAEAFDEAVNQEEFEQFLNEAQINKLVDHRRKQMEMRQEEVNRRLKESLSEKQLTRRNVTCLQKFRLKGCSSHDIDRNSDCVLTVWRPDSEWRDVQEGKRYRMFNLAASVSRQNTQHNGCKVSLTANRQTRLQPLRIHENLLDLVYEPRQIHRVAEIREKCRNGQTVEFDFLGFAVKVLPAKKPGQPHVVHAVDTQGDVLSIKFWSSVPNSNPAVKESNCFLATGLSVAGRRDPGNPTIPLTADGRPEFTSFSTSRHHPIYAKVFSDFAQLCKDPSFVSSAKSRLQEHLDSFRLREPLPKTLSEAYQEDFPQEIMDKIFCPMGSQDVDLDCAAVPSEKSHRQKSSAEAQNSTAHDLRSRGADSVVQAQVPAGTASSPHVPDTPTVKRKATCSLEESVIRKKKKDLHTRIGRLLTYGRPSPLSPLPSNSASPACGKNFKSPKHP